MVCIDTNIILLDANNIFQLGPVVIIPETVIDEVDSKKSVPGELGYQARQFGRIITRGTNRTTSTTGHITETGLTIDDITVIIVAISSDGAYPNFTDTSPSIVNDRKILHIASLYPEATFVSNDVMCRIRAESMGLKTSDFATVDQVEYEFTRDLELDFNTFSSVNNKPVFDIDPNYEPNIYAYRFTCPDSTQLKLALVQNNLIKVIGKDTERELREQLMPPMNAGQLIMSALIQDQTADLTVVDALAGSGKTVTAMSNAMKLVATNSPYDSIVYIRNSVDDIGEADEAIGFLSGNDEKLAVYLHPFYDTLHTIADRQLRGKHKGEALQLKINEWIEHIVAKYNMQAMIALGLRGRTFDNSIIIIDEAQNISSATMQKILSRVGRNCKVILIGSLLQIDSKYINRHNSSLAVLLKATTTLDWPIKLNACSLDKVVRGPITEFAEKLFSK